MIYLTLVPSYGRDYKTKKAVQEAWDAEKDFTICQFGHPDDGRQINKQQAKPGTTFNIRFDSGTRVHQIRVTVKPLTAEQARILNDPEEHFKVV